MENNNNNQSTFTSIGRSHGAPVLPATRAEWEALRNQPWLAEMCCRIEAGDEKLKHRLPVWTPHCAAFRNNHRAAADALQPLQRLMLDFDEKGHSQEILTRAQELQAQGRWQILLVEESVRRGTHVLIRLPQGMTPQEAQTRFSADVGFQADGALKDVSRCIYMVPADHTLYVDEEKLFFVNEELRMKNEKREVTQFSSSGEVALPRETGEHGGGEYPKGEVVATTQNANSQKDIALVSAATTPAVGHPSSPEEGNLDTPCANINSDTSGINQPAFKGIPYSEIIKQWFILAGGEPTTGERNSKLHRLAYHLRHITDNDKSLLLKIMPRYGLPEEEMKGLIHSACNAAWCGMPRMMQEAIDRNRRDAIHRVSSTENAARESGDAMNRVSTPPEMPEKLPPLIKLLVSRTPDIYKPAVAHAVFPSLAAHLHRVRFKYIDNVEHEATLMNVLMAGTGAGKDCISEPINRIMADIRKRDARNLERERQWKQEVNSKGANKDKRQRPEGLIIQEIDADMTNPAFVMRTAEADGHFLYTKLNEIDQFDALKGSGKGGQQFQIMCLAFDPGNRYGQTRVGSQSVTEKVTIRFNWNAATTILKGKRYFSKVLTDGPISRINFCTIPEREIGAEMPVYGSYDAAFDEELRPYIENLVRATGLVDCPEAYKLAKKLCEENAEFARLSQSRVYENLSFRANVIAYLKACVLYVAQGCKWDKTLEDFVRWSLQYDMWCKMEFFGEAIELANNEVFANKNAHGPQNLLLFLPNEFTTADAERMRQMQGLNIQGTVQMLRQWRYRRYITNITDNSYRKLKYRSDGIDLKAN